jgi:NAD(P)-dependent dehydrogenase (short-subunit alcohol dehydrogenase family)
MIFARGRFALRRLANAVDLFRESLWKLRANAILPGAVEGPRIQRILESGAKLSGKSVEEEKKSVMSIQSLQRFVDPRDIAALAVFLASDAGKSISGAMLPIDNDTQKAS